MPKEWWEDEHYADDVFVNPTDMKIKPRPNTRTYQIEVSEEYHGRVFSDTEKSYLRPIAETLALIDGNAFFTGQLPDGKEWYEQYLPEAASVFYQNGGSTGWPSDTSWMKNLTHESPAVEEAYHSWQALKRLSSAKNA